MLKKKNLKKIVAIGAVSLLGMSVFAAGCSASATSDNESQGYLETDSSEGSLTKVDDDSATVADSGNTDSSSDYVSGADSSDSGSDSTNDSSDDSTDSTDSSDSAGSSGGSEEGQIMQDGKYIHKIGDGSVTLALKTNVYDYLETVPDYRNGEYKRFALEKLAPDLGWTSETGSSSEAVFYAYLDDRELRLDTYNGLFETYWDELYVEISDKNGGSLGWIDFIENAPEKAIYLNNTTKDVIHKISLDYIVLVTFVMEHKDDLHNGDSLDDIFGAWEETSYEGSSYIIPK